MSTVTTQYSGEAVIHEAGDKLRWVMSGPSPVDRDNYLMRVAIAFIKTGPSGGVLAASAITVGSAQWYKSTGGAARTAVGAAVTPTYDATTGILYAEKTITTAGWANDDAGFVEITGVAAKLDLVASKVETLTHYFTVQDLSTLQAGTASAAWEEARSAHVGSGTFGESLNLSKPGSGTFSHPSGTTEQSIVIINTRGRWQFNADLSALAQTAKLRVYRKVGAAARQKAREYSIVPGTTANSFYDEERYFDTNEAYEATLQSDVAEGVARSIPFTVLGEAR